MRNNLEYLKQELPIAVAFAFMTALGFLVPYCGIRKVPEKEIIRQQEIYRIHEDETRYLQYRKD